ncbi:MAG: hypothetical protein PHW87_10760, partial [Methanothrix sp.]|nr:hypothetical protein [Methanothrix sp.]
TKSEFENLVYLESDFFNLGLKLGQRNGTISADKQVNLSIKAPQDVLMMAGLEYADGGAAAGDGYTFCQRNGDRYDIYAQFPEAGSYILKAYGKQKDEPGEYHEVAEYLINASGNENSTGFPLAYGKFTEVGAYLYSPLEEKLKAGMPNLFRISVPGAKNVSVVGGEEWTYLASRGELFEGNVTAGKGDVVVYAKFQGEGWDGLAKYAVD